MPEHEDGVVSSLAEHLSPVYRMSKSQPELETYMAVGEKCALTTMIDRASFRFIKLRVGQRDKSQT